MSRYHDILGELLNIDEDSDDDLDITMVAMLEEEEQRRNVAIMSHRGSAPGHRVINRNWEEGHQRLWHDYFAEVPVFPPHLFRRRFRMNRHLFCRIVDDVVARNDYFLQKRDALGVLGLSSLQKVTTAMCMLAYGQPADSIDEYIRIGESIVIQCLRHFIATVVDVYGDHYLRAPNSNDIARLLSFGEQVGFPGMLGSIDCMQRTWKNCPTTWQGMYTGHAREPTILQNTPNLAQTNSKSAPISVTSTSEELDPSELQGKAPSQK
ncbi:uncharacterized protein LOC120002560 [Tripterygium wilfordii]|uniref:uncharacterized protein LOC120002560 n=1 Tax=Tripterygium wilfordii TaxID=458696 RepID=UPI0018F835D3|nr:uncharacterized protein LOC120002560 [Tripterygium wilfordii]